MKCILFFPPKILLLENILNDSDKHTVEDLPVALKLIKWKEKKERKKEKKKFKLQAVSNRPSHPCARRGGPQSGKKHVVAMSAVYKTTIS